MEYAPAILSDLANAVRILQLACEKHGLAPPAEIVLGREQDLLRIGYAINPKSPIEVLVIRGVNITARDVYVEMKL